MSAAPQPLAGVVILNWNQAALTLRCVEHVLRQRHVPGPFTIVVVDNGSRADDVAILEAGLPADCTLLRNIANRGFAGGMNAGIDVARRQECRYVWVLNNDAFPEPDCLAGLVNAVETDATLAAVTPRLLNPDRTAQPLSADIDWETGGLKSHLLVTPPVGSGWYFTGAAFLLRCDALGGEAAFDERFFAYWEDTDLCMRLRERHWGLAIVDAAVCVHLGSASAGFESPFVTYLMTRNVALFLRRQRRSSWRRSSWRRTWLRHAALQLVHAATLDKEGAHALSRAILAGLWDGLRGRFGPPGRLEPSERIATLVLKHYWGLARAMWGLAQWLSGHGWRNQGMTFSAVLDGRADA